MTVEVIDVVSSPIEIVDLTPIQVELLTVIAGPPGPPGPPGASGNNSSIAWTQGIAAASWSIPHLLGRLPTVALYISGELVHADVFATTTVVTVVWPAPTAGVAVLS